VISQRAADQTAALFLFAVVFILTNVHLFNMFTVYVQKS